MNWSFPVFRAGETEVRIHLTFFLLLLWIGIVHLQAGGAAAAVDGVLFVIAVFVCVVLHEFGHILAARRYGIRTPTVTLLPIGGVASLERMPEKPVEEIIVALAGPMVNVVIAAILALAVGAMPDAATLSSIENPQPGFLARLAAVNLILVVFNMIPAFPMDGGRVLRAVLAMNMGRVKATRIAARVGQFAAFLFGFLGLVGGNPLLIFVAIFVYLAASSEAQVTGLLEAARSVLVRDAMITRFETLTPASTMKDAGDALLRTTQHEFPVVDGSNRLRGILTRSAMVQAIAAKGIDSPVIDAIESDIPAVKEDESLEAAVEALRRSGKRAAAVLDADGSLQGYVSQENIAELMMLREAAER